jgi:hypothetical protein
MLATREAEISRIIVQAQPGQKLHETSFQPIEAGIVRDA